MSRKPKRMERSPPRNSTGCTRSNRPRTTSRSRRPTKTPAKKTSIRRRLAPSGWAREPGRWRRGTLGMGPWRPRAAPLGRLAGLLSAGVILAGCAQSTAPHTSPKASAAAQPGCHPTPGHRGDSSPGMGPIAAGRVVLGPGMSLTPSPDLITSTRGEPLEITGVVYDRRCRPVAGSRIELWQANASGEYGPPQGSDELRCCYLQGAVETDAAGRYVVDTIKPGNYLGLPGGAPG